MTIEPMAATGTRVLLATIAWSDEL